ncbi:hypothetical protein FKW77_009494 [Venturia effusa]|uniref:Uncharacterized protein n=1 Tax=Venturia effusa TaxID=50376 RepID=A0A517L210_9PEZI|nr:hypothetical protein FKW77_009494 [Venturia effusa]
MANDDAFSAMSIIDVSTENAENTLLDSAGSASDTTPLAPTAETSPFFQCPGELRELFYTCLLSLDTSQADLCPTDINDIRGTLSIMPPPERLVSKQFKRELEHMHEEAMKPSPRGKQYLPPSWKYITDQLSSARQFPSIISLQLEIENPLEWICVHEQVQWTDPYDYPRFTTIPMRYKQRMEVLALECRCAPNLHLIPGSRTRDEVRELLDAWIVSLAEWIEFKFLSDAENLESVELTLVVEGDVEDWEANLGSFTQLPFVEKVDVVWESRLGTRALERCAEIQWPFLRALRAVWGGSGWGGPGWIVHRDVY